MLLAEPLTDRVIGLAIEAHRHSRPGLLNPSVPVPRIGRRRHCLRPAGHNSLLYKGAEVGDGFKADIVVAGELILEIKAVEAGRFSSVVTVFSALPPC